MKFLCVFVSVFCSISALIANGTGGCGTVVPANHHYNTTDQERSMVQTNANRGGLRYVPVTYHVVTKTNGTGGASLKTIFDTHCELNKGFTQPEMYFYIYSIDTISNDALWAMSDGQGGTNYNLGYSAFSNYNNSSVVNVYITGALPGLCGFATFPFSAQNGGGLFLNVQCCGAGGTTISHEMGHFFNLPHTFQQTNPVEYVDGTNCATKGDRFCDTPADPSENRASCPYNGTQTDPHGDLYNPDETLFMSYFNDNCVNRFSNQQQNEMNSTLSNERDELLNHTTPNVVPLDSAVFVSPVNGDSTSLGSLISFKWNSIPNAKYYYFHLQLANSNLVLIDTVTADTVFASGALQPNKNYKYFVRGISFGNVCESAAPYQYIQTSLLKATITVVAPSCPGEQDGAIYVNPSNGLPPYTVNWSNSQTGNNASNLSAGVYSVTITDNNGKIAVATVEVNNPLPVSVTISKVGNNLNAYGAGGTAPYTYRWSNGVNGQFNNNVPAGNYSVTVTDSKGCSAVETFIISSTGIELDTKADIHIFPNPAIGASALHVQILLNQHCHATLALVNMNGEIIEQVSKELAEGKNTVVFSTEQLPAGIYLIQFRSATINSTEGISLIK